MSFEIVNRCFCVPHWINPGDYIWMNVTMTDGTLRRYETRVFIRALIVELLLWEASDGRVVVDFTPVAFGGQMN